MRLCQVVLSVLKRLLKLWIDTRLYRRIVSLPRIWGGSKHTIVVCSTGIGPSTSIAMEELAQCGVKQFLRVGTSGAIQADIQPGDMIVTNAAVRLDGADQHFAPLAFPAVANFFLTRALVQACENLQCETSCWDHGFF